MHHNDAPNLDPRTDITDLYIFQNPGDSTKSILILNVNPEAPTCTSSEPLGQREQFAKVWFPGS